MKSINEGPTENASNWFVGVIVTAVFAALFVAGSGIWVFSFYDSNNLDKMVNASRTISPFLIAAGGVVTFFTVAWRGVINKQQAEEARRSNDHIEEARLVDTLDRAVELIRNTEIEKKIIGVKMLETVAINPSGKFSKDALQFLALQQVEAIKTASKNDANNRYLNACTQSLKSARNKGRIGNSWSYYMPESGSLNSSDIIAPGEYYFGLIMFYNKDSWVNFLDRKDIILHECVIFDYLNTNVNLPKVVANQFNNVLFRDVKFEHFGFPARFKGCNFSGCSFPDTKTLDQCSFEECYYYDNNLPSIENRKIMPESLTIDGITRRKNS